FADNILSGAAIGTVADHDELSGNFLAHEREDLDHVRDALDRPEIREVHQDRLAVGSPPRAGLRITRTLLEITVDEVRNYLDWPLDLEFSHRAIAQVIRNRGDAVALLDGKPRDRQVAAVSSHQGDIGAMERRDEWQLSRHGHHAREQCAHRMRDRIMNVQ